ncbi:hypothetical protein DL89DRAFT_293863 [Linderina pennispora]|uniref:m7GpppX diphosphatase n=1 Tax=Linderina pennispora TaxID=61395 RepID=A0A1Y1W540_9FUNG|nr:uncharacterized protein DL89DRAFT_293863 [Linderina pennispora]ORX68641.1 hypothetical protein DL89DRAFT_293863 [Linderina pennispora]
MASPTTAVSDIEALVRQFRLHEVLNEDPATKTVWLLGSIASDTPVAGSSAAVLTLERTAISPLALRPSTVLLPQLTLDSGALNDIYASATGTSHALSPDVRVSLIYPAQQKHIDKYRRQQYMWIKETAEIYGAVTRPYIDNEPKSRIQWVYNILDGSAERERVVVEDSDRDTGFVVLPDFKWDGVGVESLYLVVIVRRKDIRSLRDLRPEHLPMLRNIREKVGAAVDSVYGVAQDQLRMFVHYQPSYYHFHVHVTHVNFSGKGVMAGRAHLLDTIIDNIENIAPDYYQRASLSFTY